jgi:hypothetical protein
MSRNKQLEERLREWRAAEDAEAGTDPASPERRDAITRTRRARHAYESEAVRQADAHGALGQDERRAARAAKRSAEGASQG